MRRIYLNQDKKLVVETDNGMINPDGTTIVGIGCADVYTINPDDIAELLKIVNHQDTKVVYRYKPEGYYLNYEIISNEEIVSDFKEMEGKFKRDIQILEDMHEKCFKRKEYLENEIIKFNGNPKLFWRPIKIDWDGNT